MFKSITKQSTQDEIETLVVTFVEGIVFVNSPLTFKHLPELRQKVEETNSLPYDQLIDAVELYYKGKYMESEMTFSLLINLQWKSNLLIGFINIVRGGNLRSLGQIDRAVLYLNEGLKRLGTNQVLNIYKVYAYYQLGGIYVMLEEYDKAEEYLYKSLKENQVPQNPSARYRVTAGLGDLYLKKGDLDIAIGYLIKGQDLALGKPRNESNAYHDLGEYYYQKGDCNQAIEMSNKAIQIRKKEGFNDALTTSYLLKAKVLLLKKEPQESIRILEETLPELRLYGVEDKEKNCLFLLSTAHEDLGNYPEAFKYLKLYDKIQTESFYKQRKHILQQKNSLIEEQNIKLDTQNREITASINYSRHLQNAILPPKPLIQQHFSKSFVYYQPKDIVAGDFYWLNTPDMRLANCDFDDVILIAAADCTGHGVPGAIVSFICSDLLNRAVDNLCSLDPGRILDETLQLLIKRFQISTKRVSDGMDISLAAFNTKTLELNWAGANNPLFYIKDGEFETIKGNKQSISYHANPELYTSHFVQLEEGDRFFLGTDGYPDQFGGDRGKKLGTRKYKEILENSCLKEIDELGNYLASSHNDWRINEEQVDDICVIGIEI